MAPPTLLPRTPLRNASSAVAVSALALSLTAAGAIPFTAAHAGDNDHLTVATESHVDSPKVFWDSQKGTFTLNSEFRGKDLPIESTVNWVGKGYSSGSSRSQQYVFRVGDDPRLSFLGTKGDALYMAPAVPQGPKPIWAGFGADSSIPVDKFRDKSFSLDIIDFNGPGRMEMFQWGEDVPPTRLLSSHDKGLRSAWIEPGNHTHNYTTFTKPGTYTVTYRATARGTDGSLIASKPQTFTWQVGGTKPSSDGLGTIKKAWDAASSTSDNKDGVGTLTVRPSASRNEHEPLSTLNLTLGDRSRKGHVAFYVDGYYLAEVPVKDGVATWDELLGPKPSNVQAVFIPSDGGDRWASAPVSSSNMETRTQTTTKPSAFPVEKPTEPTTKSSLKEIDATSLDYTASVSDVDAEDDSVDVTVTPADDRLVLSVTGGFYESKDATAPSCVVTMTSRPGSRVGEQDGWGCDEKQGEWRLRIVPHALANVGASDVAVKPGSKATGALAQGTELPGKPNPTPSDPPTDPEDEHVHISQGHVDLGPVAQGDGLDVVVGDDSRQHAQTRVERPTDTVVLDVPSHAHATRGGRVFGDERYNFLGKEGTDLWVLPQDQQQGKVWPGFSTEHVNADEYPKGIDLEVAPVSAPQGGAWWAFSSTLTGVQKFASSEGPATINNDGPAHLHPAWVFNTPGTYKISVKAVGVNASGKKVESPARVVTFEVAAANNAPAPKEPTGQPSAPKPAETQASDTQPSDPHASTAQPADPRPSAQRKSEASPSVTQASDARQSVTRLDTSAAISAPGSPVDRAMPTAAPRPDDSDKQAPEKRSHQCEAAALNEAPSLSEATALNIAQPEAQGPSSIGRGPAVSAAHDPDAKAPAPAGSHLPRTGTDVIILGGIALAIVAAGATALAVGRRRSKR